MSIKLTQYALTTLRARARDDTFATCIQHYLGGDRDSGVGSRGRGAGSLDGDVDNAHPTNTSASNNNNTTDTANYTTNSATPRAPVSHSCALLRKRIYDKYSAECKNAQLKHAFDAELNRRRMALFLYLIRSPVFDRLVCLLYGLFVSV